MGLGTAHIKQTNPLKPALAPVLGGEVLPGAVPMEGRDLVIPPSQRRGTVNPASPNIAVSIAKGFQSGFPA